MKEHNGMIIMLWCLCISTIWACETVQDCSLNGACTNGKCDCEPAWVGLDCGALNLLPTPNDVYNQIIIFLYIYKINFL